MANTVIRLKKSSISGRSPNTLDHGELAINYTDGKLFYKDDANVIQRISGGANSFMYMNVAGTMLVAGVLADVLTINEGDNIQINTDVLTNKYTITANLRPAFRVANAAFALANDMYNVSTVVSNTAPANPVQGKLWWNSILGTLFVYYVDPDGTTSWVEAVPNGGGTSGGSTANLTPVFQVANAAFDKANNALANTNNVVFAGDLRVTGNVFIGSNTVTITNNSITVETISATNLSVNGSALPSGSTVNLSFDVANAAFDKANSANVLAYNTGIGANNYANTLLVTARAYTNTSVSAANDYTNTVLTLASAAFDRANSSNDVLFVAASFDKANAANVLAAAAFNAANNAVTDFSPAFNKANSAYTVSNAAFDKANSAYNLAINAGSSVVTSNIAPVGPSDGSLWWNSDIGKLLIYYDDGNSSQWVEATTGQVTGGGVAATFDKANAAYAYANTLTPLGIFDSTVLAFPLGDFANSEVGLSTYIDAFGIATAPMFDCQDPVGDILTQDLGSDISI